MIFINYRRADASADARAVHAQLRRTFSEIFIDIDTIRKGVNFVNELEQTLPKTAVMLVLVGRSWLSPRLEKEDDFVRMEISGRSCVTFQSFQCS